MKPYIERALAGLAPGRMLSEGQLLFADVEARLNGQSHLVIPSKDVGRWKRLSKKSDDIFFGTQVVEAS